MRRAEILLVVKLTGVIGLGLLVLLGALGWFQGWVSRPAFVCEAWEAWCTPTPEVPPTYTPYPTFTPEPTDAPYLTFTPEATQVSRQTLTSTPARPRYADLLGGCAPGDFDAEMRQTSPIEVGRFVRSAGERVPGLETTYLITNTGTCLLVQSELLGPGGAEAVAELPDLLNAGDATELTYVWPELTPGRHTFTMTLLYHQVDGKIAVLTDREFVLALELTTVQDTDGDRVADVRDACPELPGAGREDGCPDADGDGLIDPEDCCPDVPGPSALSGCPDTDGDGFVEVNTEACPALSVDECPDRCGQDGGCPICHTQYDRCTRTKEVCETDPGTGEENCHTEEVVYDCNPHEICEPCP